MENSLGYAALAAITSVIVAFAMIFVEQTYDVINSAETVNSDVEHVQEQNTNIINQEINIGGESNTVTVVNNYYTSDK